MGSSTASGIFPRPRPDESSSEEESVPGKMNLTARRPRPPVPSAA